MLTPRVTAKDKAPVSLSLIHLSAECDCRVYGQVDQFLRCGRRRFLPWTGTGTDCIAGDVYKRQMKYMDKFMVIEPQMLRENIKTKLENTLEIMNNINGSQ